MMGLEKQMFPYCQENIWRKEGKRKHKFPLFKKFYMYLLLYESIYFVWGWWYTYHNICAEARGYLARVISVLLPCSSQEPNSGDQGFISYCMKTKKCEWAKSQVSNRARITTSIMTLQNYTSGSGHRWLAFAFLSKEIQRAELHNGKWTEMVDISIFMQGNKEDCADLIQY